MEKAEELLSKLGITDKEQIGEIINGNPEFPFVTGIKEVQEAFDVSEISLEGLLMAIDEKQEELTALNTFKIESGHVSNVGDWCQLFSNSIEVIYNNPEKEFTTIVSDYIEHKKRYEQDDDE